MNTFFKSLTAAAVGVTITTMTLAAPAEAKVRGRDVAIGLAVGLTALAIASQPRDHGRPVYRHRPRDFGPPRRSRCGWMKRKARHTDSPYWWGRYDACMGR